MVLVTGANGFLGRYIVAELAAQGFEVKALMRNMQQNPFAHLPKVQIVEGDVLDIMLLEKAFEGVQYVIHAAAIVSFDSKDAEKMMKTNVEGTANVVNLCLDKGIEKLVFVSSIAALGRTDNHELITEHTRWVDSPLNSKYALSKRKAELEVYRGMEEGLEVAILCPGVILGFGDWEKGSAKLFKIVHKGLPFYNRGINGVVGVEDVARACRFMLEQQTDKGEKFILVAQNMSQKEMFTLMAKSLKVSPPKYEFPQVLAKVAGFVLEFGARLFGKTPIITRETVRTSLHQHFYDGTHIQKRFGFRYTEMDKVIAAAGEQFLNMKK